MNALAIFQNTTVFCTHSWEIMTYFIYRFYPFLPLIPKFKMTRRIKQRIDINCRIL